MSDAVPPPPALPPVAASQPSDAPYPIAPNDISHSPESATTPSGPSSAQYLRTVSIIVADKTGKGIELGNMKVKFQVHHATFVFPHTADVRVYNLSDATITTIQKEFTSVIIQAGYKGNFGTIFTGTVKQIKKGRENALDSYIDIYAADGDQWHNNAMVSSTLAAGHTQQQVWSTVGDSITATKSATVGPPSAALRTTRSPRGRVFFGMARDYMRQFGRTNNLLVTTDNGVVKSMPISAYKPGDTIIINSLSGMVGIPEQTNIGITVTTLLNPSIQWGSRIQINQADIAQNLINEQQFIAGSQSGSGGPQKTQVLPSVSADGFYKVLTVDHTGDTRGNEYFSHVLGFTLDPSVQNPFGTESQAVYGTYAFY